MIRLSHMWHVFLLKRHKYNSLDRNTYIIVFDTNLLFLLVILEMKTGVVEFTDARPT